MNFRRKKIRGQNKKVRRTWVSAENYRIVWRREFYGVALPPRFQPAVRVYLTDGSQVWDFAGRRRLCKTMKTAVEVCEHHYNLWSKVGDVGIRGLIELFGRVPSGFSVWFKPNRRVYELLMNRKAGKRDQCDEDIPVSSDSNTSDLTETSESSGSHTEAPETAQEKLAGKRTRKPSKRTAKRKTSTTDSSATGKTHSLGSRKKKSKPSEN